MNSRNFTLLCIILLSCFIISIESIEVEKTIHAKPYITIFQKFGFDSNGTFSFHSVNLSPSTSYPTVLFYFCTDGQWRDLVSFIEIKGNTYSICSSNYSQITTNPQCEISAVPFRTGSEITPAIAHHTVQNRALYRFIIVNCYEIEKSGAHQTIDASLHYTLLNPGNKHLSFGAEYLPEIYAGFFALWGWLAATWLMYLVLHPPWRTRNVTSLHVLYEVVILGKIAVTVMAFTYWHICESSGKCVDFLQYVQSFMFAVSESIFFCLILLIAKGWKITRWNLPGGEIRRISVALILLLSTLLFFSLYNDSYYFLSLLIMYFFMLPKILAAITRNSRSISAQIFFISHLNPTQRNGYPEISLLNKKLTIFKNLRILVIVYLLLILLVSGARLIVVWYWEWMAILGNEIIVYLMVLLVGLFIRPSLNVFNREDLDNANFAAIFNMLENGDFNSGENLIDDDSLSADGVPLIKIDGQVNDLSEVVVFQFPCTFTSKMENEEGDGSVTSSTSTVNSSGSIPGVAMYPLAFATVEKFERKTKKKKK